ncbi:hypothetical protein DCAR_0935821 [Daucus carota subsp. sativus]|uniref:Cystatin domain-containing protein n=1 Tax=Daucus carota subsp. sativus TaxID=79200 RepID=A0A175YJ44_DAUCS|nr:PREDICTED: uncharacterized protein LOC108202310 isoform X1 [Daucus carota subsp. sativus]WOH16271.1 hypothetical protein DCAR_0935821 [Daucus carota subsp. sativus]
MDQDGPWSCNLEIYPDFREEKVSEEYTLCTESGAGSKLPLYLSQLALEDYDKRRNDIIRGDTMKQNEKYDILSVNVLKTMKSVEAEGTTYLINFEASLQDYKNKNPRTFQTKILMSPVNLPSMKVDVRFVRTKPR